MWNERASSAIPDRVLALCLLLVSCYPKVHLTQAERERVPLAGHKRDIVLTRSADGSDTLRFSRQDGPYEAGFDVAYERSLGRRVRGPERSYLSSYAASSNFHLHHESEAELKVWCLVHFTKLEGDSVLSLSIDPFTERYTLNEQTPDTLLFEHFERMTVSTCSTCTRRLIWHTREGVLSIEKMDGTVWTRSR
jgi:hypothetical protein